MADVDVPMHDGRMHDDEVTIGEDQVGALVAEQLPSLAGLDVTRVEGGGTVNTIFRIGEEVVARFPRRAGEPSRVRYRLGREAAAAAEFRQVCSVPAPEPLHTGHPGHGYPLPWSAQTWVRGSTATPISCQHSTALADDLIGLLQELRAADIGGRRFHGEGRGGSLRDHDAWVEECIRRSEGLVDTAAMGAAWARFRRLPATDADIMCHGDLIPSNVLVSGGRLRGVLDTGGYGPADPALDLVAGWHLLADGPRERLRRGLECSDLQWERGRAWAFEQAAGAYWYYQDTNSVMAEMGRTTLARILSAGA